MRHRDPLTDEQRQRARRARPRARRRAACDPSLRELEELVRDVRATAPEMSPGFAARLEHEVRRAFLRRRSARRCACAARWPAGAGCCCPPPARSPRCSWRSSSCSAAATTTVATSRPRDDARLGGRRGGDPAADGGAAGSAVRRRRRRAAPRQRRSRSATAPPTGPPRRPRRPGPPRPRSPARSRPSPPAGAIAPAPARKVERSAVLALRTPDDELRADDRRRHRAPSARFGGIVASSQIGASDAAGGEASFDLRIPTERLDRALAALSKLGHVTERNQSLQDITASFTSRAGAPDRRPRRAPRPAARARPRDDAEPDREHQGAAAHRVEPDRRR